MRDGWVETTLGEVARIQQGKTLAVKDMDGGDHPVYGANGVIGWYHKSNTVERTVALGCRGSCGTVSVVNPGAWLANNVMSVTPSGNDLSIDFLALLLETADLVGGGVIAGQVQPQITRTSLSPLTVVLPPLAEQRRIVDLIAALDAALAAAERASTYSRVARRALLGDALDGGGDGWRTVTLGDIGQWNSGSTPKAGHAAYYGGAIPFVAIGDLADGPVRDTAKTLTEEGLAQIGRIAPEGSVFLSMYGTIGKVGIATRPMATNQAIAWLECDKSQCEPEFMLMLLSSKAEYFDSLGRGATQRNINREIVKATEILLPPLEQQRHIAQIVGAFDLLVDACLTAAGSLREGRAAILAELLSGDHGIPESYDAFLDLTA